MLPDSNPIFFLMEAGMVIWPLLLMVMVFTVFRISGLSGQSIREGLDVR